MTGGLLVAETHPIQYHAPVYRALQQHHGVPVTVVYGTDVSLQPYRDREFGAEVSWDVDLLGGYSSHFLSTVDDGGTVDPWRTSARGFGQTLDIVCPRAVLIVGYSPPYHRFAWGAAWRRRLPVLFRGETSDLGQTTRRSVAMARDMMLRVAYRSCQRVLYIGERSRRHYRDHGVEDARLVSSPYCVDTTPFTCGEPDRARLRHEARAEVDAGDDQIVLLFCGKLSARKGVDLIVPAVRHLPATVQSRVVVVCAGDGELRTHLHAEASASGVPLRVLGVLAQRRLSRWYHAADLLVLPSRRAETWGLVVNEALHHGVPVVASDRVGCAPDLIDSRTGAVFDAESPEALAAAIVGTLPLAGRADVREWCRAKVAPYSVDRAAEGIAQAFCAVAAKKRVT